MLIIYYTFWPFDHHKVCTFTAGYEGGLISLWLYKENNTLRDWKNVFTLNIPPEPHTLMTSLF
jgi:hypothetical protein